MRVVVVGASGNVGTGLLRALAGRPEVSSVVAVARRLPDRGTVPYDAAEWVRLDLADPVPAGRPDPLEEAFTGADTVVHLAWALQPNRMRDYLRRVNVDGTARVLGAAARAGAGHVVAASSWGAYSPVTDDRPRDESWFTGGVRSSHYSVDKAAQERLLDAFQEAHPEIVVSRMRKALVFQRDAGASIARYFLGPLVPVSVLRPGLLPALPMLRNVWLQVLHADDAGEAYATVVTRRAPGAFNVAAAELLTARDLADLLDHGVVVTLPRGLTRAALTAAWRARAVAADPGWLDMAVGAPVMDTSRIRALGWQERHDARATLLEMLDGMRGRHGLPSPPLRPADRSFGAPGDPTERDLVRA